MRYLRPIALLSVLFLAACAANPRVKTTRADVNYGTVKAAYLLDTGDVLRVSVYNDAQLTNSYGIDDAGYISIPLVGRINVRGKTVSQTASFITHRLASGYLRDPNVAVEVAQYRPFYIQGEVTTSGQFPFVFGMTVRAAVSTAGGFTDVAAEQSVTIHRQSGGRIVAIKANLDAPVQPGDTIVVHERWL